MKLFELMPEVRQAILTSAAAAIGRNSDRGDEIVEAWNEVLDADYKSGRSSGSVPATQPTSDKQTGHASVSGSQTA